MKYSIFLTIVLYMFTANAKEIAISFDDSPMRDMPFYSGSARTDELIEVLKKTGVTTAFFSNSNKITNADEKKRLERYGRSGHFIANHTHSHPDLRKISAKDYIREIENADNFALKK